MRWQSFLIVGFMMLLPLAMAACTPTVANRGILLEPEQIAAIKLGTSTREMVLSTLGTPSSRGSFDDSVWYYIGRNTEQEAFFDPKLTDQQIVTINFDDKGVVKAVQTSGKDAARAITIARDETPTFGTGTTWLQDLFGNIGRAGLPTERLQR